MTRENGFLSCAACEKKVIVLYGSVYSLGCFAKVCHSAKGAQTVTDLFPDWLRLEILVCIQARALAAAMVPSYPSMWQRLQFSNAVGCRSWNSDILSQGPCIEKPFLGMPPCLLRSSCAEDAVLREVVVMAAVIKEAVGKTQYTYLVPGLSPPASP